MSDWLLELDSEIYVNIKFPVCGEILKSYLP